MIFKTKRLVLRHWKERDAFSLFQYAKDADVGPRAGWMPHQSVEESLEIFSMGKSVMRFVKSIVMNPLD